MAKRGAPLGNQNASDGKVWRAAIHRALEKRNGKGKTAALDEIANKLLAAAEEGQIPALRELGDRLDGKAVQQVEMDANVSAKVIYEVKGLD